MSVINGKHLKTTKIQESNHACFVYIPKIWLKLVGLEKGDEISMFISEEDSSVLELRIEK